MNLREMIGEYATLYARWVGVIGWAGEGAERVRWQFCEAENRIKRAAELAEAAMEHCDALRRVYQIDEGLLPTAEYTEAYQEAIDTYRRWSKLRESMHQSGEQKKE